MIIATWNINGIKARIEVLLAWLAERSPDLVCLQEIKSVDETFPREALEAKGWHVETHGQKGFNGVALISKAPPVAGTLSRGLPGDDMDDHARYIEAQYAIPSSASGQSVHVASLYLPNGNPIGTEKFDYKLGWMRRLERHAQTLLAAEHPFILAGDYNVIPQPEDVKNPAAWVGDALFQPETRASYRRLLNLGLTDVVRASTDRAGIYSFWDYQAGAWQKNNGIRIDHLLLSPEVASRVRAAGIDSHVRGWEKPSDHVPVLVELKG